MDSLPSRTFSYMASVVEFSRKLVALEHFCGGEPERAGVSSGLRLALGVAVILISSSALPLVCAAAVGCLLSRLRLRSVSRPPERLGPPAWLASCVAESRRDRPNQHGRQGNGAEERS